MAEVISFFIKGRPIAFARAGRNGKQSYTPEPQKSYMQAIGWEARKASCGEVLRGDLRMIIRATFKPTKAGLEGRWKRSKPDADNLAKIQADALQDVLYADDAQIVEMIIQKKYGLPEGVTVTVSQLEESV